MRIVMFYHSLLSDWNHGNAHFLRGIASELIARGHRVDIYEPEDSWSLQSLIQEHGEKPLRKFWEAYPTLKAKRYRFGTQAELERAVPPHPDPLPRGEGTACERASIDEMASCKPNAGPARNADSREKLDTIPPLPKGEGRGEGKRAFRTSGGLISSQQLLPQAIPLELDEALDGADLVIVHEWNAHKLVCRIGEHRARNDYVVLFHDTHHRMVTQPESMAAYDLSHYDGVLAYGEVLRELYEARGNVARAWTWHEAADTRVFKPVPGRAGCPQPAAHGAGAQNGAMGTLRPARDLVWIGNWGDDERTAELHEFLIEPAKELQLNARVYGVRYPDAAQTALRDAGIDYGNWLPNFEAPRVFGEFKFTVHVPRRPYVKTLPGIPTIRPFEALACGIPLICSPWNDAEHLFRPGTDYLVANNGTEMKQHMRAVLNDPQLAAELARNGLETIRKRHTCAHRVDELLSIYAELTGETYAPPNAVNGSPSPLNGERAGVRGGQSDAQYSRREALGGSTPHPHSLSPLRGEGGAQHSASATPKRVLEKEVPA
jgi:spore maturation protein CgeB